MPEDQDPRDPHQIRVEYLQARQKTLETTQLVLDGVRMIVVGGTQGIQEVALSHPDVIMAAFVGLSEIIEQQERESTQLAEDWLQALDDLRQARESMEDFANRLGLVLPE